MEMSEWNKFITHLPNEYKTTVPTSHMNHFLSQWLYTHTVGTIVNDSFIAH